MVLFNWKKIYDYTKGSSSKILLILEYITYRPVPLNKQDLFYSLAQMNWGGDSFLLNPEDLLTDRRHSMRERAQYIGLASFRNTGEYLAHGIITLDLANCPVGKDTLNRNRLLIVENGKIHFHWEEVARRKKNGSI
jgi:hypothetical protein